MGKRTKPKDVRKRLKEIVKKSRANNRRHRNDQNREQQNDANDKRPIHVQHNHNHNAYQFGKKRGNYDETDGLRRDDVHSKQYRGVWRCKKGGQRYYVALDGQEYEAREARRQCAIDKQRLQKLAETKRQLQSPSLQYALQHMNECENMNERNTNNNNSNGFDMRCTLNYWQIPHEIVTNYAQCGIKKLYPWQIECLSLVMNTDSNNNKSNSDHLLYSAPTSGGKTLISEILMIRHILVHRKKCLFILPFISLVNEKVNDLKRKLSSLGIVVEAYHSSISLSSMEDADILCCTIEKANAIINKLIEEDSLIDCLGCIVIDEFHYIGDAHRGWIIEILLAKILYLSRFYAAHIQIVAMSATLPNLQHIANWLHAKLYLSEIRPVSLTQYYKHNDILYNVKGDEIRKVRQTYEKDKDHVVALCEEVIADKGSVLVFCEKKVWCKTCCQMIADCLSMQYRDQSKRSNVNNAPSLLIKERELIIEQLRELPTPICSVLERSILHGVAYHHAGLTLEEREIIETGFRKNVIFILVATSTLAAGVNLPARRVIFRTPKVGRNYIDAAKYRQMSGRAGRKGIDDYGESIVICRDQSEMYYVREKLMNAPLQPIKSQILQQSDNKNTSNNLQRFILEGFATKFVKTYQDLDNYLKLSLQCTEIDDEKQWTEQYRESVQWLIHNAFLKVTKSDSPEKEELGITSLGEATIGSGLDPTQSKLVFDEIAATRQKGICLSNALHICYLLSPIRNNAGNVEPHWELFYDLFIRFGQRKKEIAKSIGIEEKVLCDFANNMAHRPNVHNVRNLQQYIKYKRFYVAIILNKIIEEHAVHEIEAQFGIDGGKMQALQSTAASFANSLSVFCMKLNWNCMAGIIAHFGQRLDFGVSSELLPLMKISHIKGFRARCLFENGIQSVEDIVSASLESIVLALSSRAKFDEDNKAQRCLMQINAQKIKHEASCVLNRIERLNEQQELEQQEQH